MKTKFLPKKYIDVEICNIYENRDAVIIQHTDTLQDNTAFNAEALGFKFGLKPTAFHWAYSAIQDGLSDIADSEVIKFGVYIPTDRYRSESLSRYLPDYAGTTVTQAGSIYYGRNIGEIKEAGKPNNGQELFDFSNGVKGYDVVNGVAGSEGNMDFIREMEYIDNWYLQNFGRLPSTGSDRQGKIGSKEVYVPHYLGIRSTVLNSTATNHEYSDIDRLGLIHKPLTSRWENGFASGDMTVVNKILVDSINNAFEVNGIFNDFVHWHRAITVGGNIYLLHDLYELIYNTVDGRNAWYTGYSEAVEYYWFKTMTKRVRAGLTKDKTKILLTADFDDEYYNQTTAGLPMRLLYDRIKQPLSVKIDLAGTVFQGKNIKTNFNKPLSLGNNQYIIDIPFGGSNGFQEVIIQETETADYKNFNKPNIEIAGNVLKSDIPVKVVLFKGDFSETMAVLERSNKFSKEHTLQNVNISSYIGVVTEYGTSMLVDYQTIG